MDSGFSQDSAGLQCPGSPTTWQEAAPFPRRSSTSPADAQFSHPALPLPLRVRPARAGAERPPGCSQRLSSEARGPAGLLPLSTQFFFQRLCPSFVHLEKKPTWPLARVQTLGAQGLHVQLPGTWFPPVPPTPPPLHPALRRERLCAREFQAGRELCAPQMGFFWVTAQKE